MGAGAEKLNEGMVWEITPYQDTSGELRQRPMASSDVFASVIPPAAEAVRAYNALTPEEKLARDRQKMRVAYEAAMKMLGIPILSKKK